jgi:ABC-type Fe3+ transport system substrate-binding protein
MARAKRLAAGGCLFALLVALGCHGDPAAGPGQRLLIISPHRDEIKQEVERGFNAWLGRHPEYGAGPVALVWVDVGGGSSQIQRYLTGEYARNPESCGIDLLYGGGTDLYYDLKPKGVLEPFKLPEALGAHLRRDLHGVPLRDPEGDKADPENSYWFGVMLSSLGILYNAEVLDRIGLHGWFPPQSWKALADPRLLGWVSAGDPRMSGSVHMNYEWILQRYGWDEGFAVLLRLGANARGFARYSDGVSRDVVLGKAAAGGTLDSYGFSALAREQRDLAAGTLDRPQLGMILPPGEVVINPDSVGILKGPPNRTLAEAFVVYNLSADGGQELWGLQPQTTPEGRARYPGSPHRYAICRLPLVEDLYDPQRYPPAVRAVTINPFDPQTLGKVTKQYDNKTAEGRRRGLLDLFGAWIIDPHPELHAAWRAVASLPPDRRVPLERELFAPPCSWQEFQAAQKGLFLPAEPGKRPEIDPRKRTELVARWLDEARARYRKVLATAAE